MTAQLVDHDLRQPSAPWAGHVFASRKGIDSREDMRRRARFGQLWQREAARAEETVELGSAPISTTLKVGNIVLAEWAVGPAQRGSGWLRADVMTNPTEWVVREVWPSGITLVQRDSGPMAIIRDGEYRLVGRFA